MMQPRWVVTVFVGIVFAGVVAGTETPTLLQQSRMTVASQLIATTSTKTQTCKCQANPRPSILLGAVTAPAVTATTHSADPIHVKSATKSPKPHTVHQAGPEPVAPVAQPSIVKAPIPKTATEKPQVKHLPGVQAGQDKKKEPAAPVPVPVVAPVVAPVVPQPKKESAPAPAPAPVMTSIAAPAIVPPPTPPEVLPNPLHLLNPFQTSVLVEHNMLRAKHGEAPLEYNKTLEAYAQNWVDHCQWQHSDGPYGENLAEGYPMASSKEAVQDWYDESKTFDWHNGGYDEQHGHFTQVIWRDTTQVGCAMQTCPSLPYKYFLSCNYSPPGNIIRNDIQSDADRAWFRTHLSPPLAP